jgi:Domain of unknown function (DUF1707)/Domain of unknown function (DUF4190)
MSVDPVSGSMFSRPGGNGTVAGPRRMLAAHADRERAIDVLKAGFAEGRLTKAEYDYRTARVYAARTYGELGALIADLPTGPLGGQPSYPSVDYPPWQPAHSTTSPLAVAALVCGIGEFFTLGLTAIPAVILGHLARRQLRQTDQRGDGLALTGLILGYAGIALLAFMLTLMIVVASKTGHVVHAVVIPPAHSIIVIPPAPGPPLGG